MDEPSPLAGRRIVVTRPDAGRDAFSQRLAAAGAHVIACPTIRLALTPDRAALEHAFAAAATYDWVVFTSANAARFFAEVVDAEARMQIAERAQIAAVGPATADQLAALGLAPTLVAEQHVAEGLAEALGNLQGQSVLLPQAAMARATLGNMLQTQGARVTIVPLYETVAVMPSEATLAELDHDACVFTFTSSSTVTGLATALLETGRTWRPSWRAACIGPITAATAQILGWPISMIAIPHTTDGLFNGLVRFFASDSLSA
ncbi:MAG: uroporphyrinogen-III synthase [Bacteroidota bacterium]